MVGVCFEGRWGLGLGLTLKGGSCFGGWGWLSKKGGLRGRLALKGTLVTVVPTSCSKDKFDASANSILPVFSTEFAGPSIYLAWLVAGKLALAKPTAN